MKIVKKRIRALENYLVGINDQENFFIALTNLSNEERVKKAGFSNHLTIGEKVLPTIVGNVTKYNANGGFNIHRNLPKETVYRQAEIKDWHGNYHLVDIPYKRYPRTPIPPPNIELVIVEGGNGKKIIRSPQLTKGLTPNSLIIHTFNLFLELFEECDTIKSNLLPVFNVELKRLNWTLLPQGSYPWNIIKSNVQQVINKLGDNKRHLIERRLEVITSFNPNFVAYGNAGFNGYFVFGFPDKDFFILENLILGNATYVFGQNWEELSQLTKAEILKEDLQTHRFVHNSDWENQINELF